MSEREEQGSKSARDWSSVNRSPHAVVTVWMRPEQRAYIERQADAAGCSMSEYMRAAALGVKPLKSRPRLDPDRQLCAKMLAEMGKMGSNLNQIARSLNQNQIPSLDEMRTLKEARDLLREMAAVQMKALGREA